MSRAKVRFGPFELDTRAGELWRGRRRVPLQDKPLQLLLALIEQPNQVVGREELRSRLWPPNVVVEFDNGLNNAANKLRAALGDSADAPTYIETVGRRGYRFIGTLDCPGSIGVSTGFDAAPGAAIAPTAVAARREHSGAPRPRIGSLAVLPLANLSSDAEQEYFSDGMTDALISQLAGIRSLRIISRQSVMRFKNSTKPMPEIARELGVDGIVEGTVLRAADRVRISVQLIHGPVDSHLWAAQYERPLDDVIALQAEIAQTVAQEIMASVTPQDTALLALAEPVDAEAYDIYLRGRFFWERRTEEALHRALHYFERAVAIQPDFARAHAAIAQAYAPLGNGGFAHPAETTPKMRAAAERALALQPDLVEGLTALGACAAFHEWRWTEGERHLLRALEINSNVAGTHMWYGLWLESQGRQAENLKARRRAFELDPLGGAATAAYASALSFNGRLEEAIAVLEKTLEIDPDNPQLLGTLAKSYLAVGRREESIAVYGRARGLGGLGYNVGLGGLGHAYGVAGRKQEALAVLAELERLSHERYVAPHHFALVHVGLGSTSAALDALERGFDIRDSSLSGIKVAPAFAPVRNERRFRALLARMGLG